MTTPPAEGPAPHGAGPADCGDEQPAELDGGYVAMTPEQLDAFTRKHGIRWEAQ